MGATPRPSPGMRLPVLRLGAWLAWSAVLLQLYLLLLARWQDGASLLGGLLAFFSFFTVQSNILVALVLSCAASSGESAVARLCLRPSVCGAVAANILLVGLGYNLLLRHLWAPTGVQWLVNEVLHDLMPLLFLAYWWWCVPKGRLRPWHLLAWMAYPLAYFALVLLRGEWLGAYPYPFIDVDTLGYPQVLINAGQLLLGFVLLAGLVIGLDRWRGRH